MITDILNSQNNIIPTVMTPYTYAIGAILASIASPFILKLILSAPETNCFQHSDGKTNSIQLSTQQTRTESKFAFLCLFVALTITSAIAAHAHSSWSLSLLALLTSWVIIAEVTLEIRVKVISSWLPVIAIWLGLIFNADPTNMANLHPINYIAAPVLIWSVASIIKNMLNQSSSLYKIISPICLSIPGAWLGIEAATIMTLKAIAISALIIITEHVLFSVLKKINPSLLLQPKIAKQPFNAIFLIVIWFMIIS